MNKLQCNHKIVIMKTIKYLLIVLGMIVASGCSTSRITSEWKSPDAYPGEYKKVLVLGLIRDADRNLQQNMENHLVGDLRDMGYQAVSSLQQYGPKAFDNMNEAEAIQNLSHNGFDAVLTIVMLDKTKESRYVAGNMYYSPYRYNYNRFWGYRVSLYSRIYEPGYYVTDTRYFWESNLYDMSNQKLVYSVQTESFDPINSESLGHEYGQLIVKNMVSQSVLRNIAASPSRAF
jgi:hypothetical protein